MDELTLENERLKSNLKYADSELGNLREFLRHAPALAWIKTADGQYRYASEGLRRHFGFKEDDLLWHTDLDLLPAAYALSARKRDLTAMSSEKAVHSLEAIPGTDGAEHQWLVVRFPFTDAAGVNCVGGIALDIAATK